MSKCVQKNHISDKYYKLLKKSKRSHCKENCWNFDKKI